MQLDDLINEIVELEGLLRVLRDRKAPAVRSLAESKYRELSNHLNQYFGANTPASPLESLSQATITFPDEEKSAPEAPQQEAPVATPPPFVEAMGVVEEIIPAEDENEDGDIRVTLAEPVEEQPQPEEQPEEQPQPVEQPVEQPQSEEQPEEQPVEQPQPAPAVSRPEETERPLCVNENVRAADLARAFTINDRFLFIRELFRGNADDFDQTVQVLSDMPDLAEAREYLFQDLMWDSSDEAVQAFMNILVRYLPEAK